MLSTVASSGAARIALLCFALLSLVACGGGGGGSGNPAGNPVGNPGGGGDSVAGRGGFTLGATVANLRTLRNGALPVEVRIPVTVTGNAVAVFGAAFVDQSPPHWLTVNVEGTGKNLTLVLGVTTTLLEPQQYTSTLTVGTADQAGSILATREIPITYDVVQGMQVSASPQGAAIVFGSSVSTAAITVSVGAPGKAWTITSNQAWLPVPAGVQQGDASLALTLNGSATGRAPGETAVAEVVVQNVAEPIDRHVMSINAEILPPVPVVSVDQVALGGVTGLGPLTQQLNVSLNTGSNAYPLTLTIDAPQMPAWVVANASGGTISGVQQSVVTFTPSAGLGAQGQYTATAHFDVEVANQTFRRSVPITLKWHGQRLVPEQAGVAFSSFPAMPSPGSRTLKIRGSRGVGNVVWAAASNRSWLAVTPSGVTGGDLVLTANQSGLANGLHVAQVTLTSTSAGIERTETIRVGLWVGSTNPADVDVSLPAFSDGITINPVEPYAYSLSDGVISVYNVHTGMLITTFSDNEFEHREGGVLAYPVSMDVSDDGTTLYLANGRTSRVVAVDAASGAQRMTYQLEQPFGSSLDAQVRYVRTNGYPTLWTPFGDFATQVIDLEAGAPIQFTSEYGGGYYRRFDSVRGFTADGSRMFTINGASTSTRIDQFTATFGVADGRTVEIRQGASVLTAGNGFVRQICGNASGTRLYARNTGVVDEYALDVDPWKHIRSLTPPDGNSVQALECNRGGPTYVGLSATSQTEGTVYLLDTEGEEIGSMPIEPMLMDQQMRVSGDGRRIVAAHVVPGNPPGFALVFYNVQQ